MPGRLPWWLSGKESICPLALLVRMQIDTATMENSMEILLKKNKKTKTRNKTTI